MTSRDYILIANALAYAQAHGLSAKQTTQHLAECLELQNSNFDKARFLAQVHKTLSK